MLSPPFSAQHDFPRRQHLRTLVGVELATGLAAMIGGLLLMIQPDGSLLAADTDDLRGSPFTNWAVPGLLLATLVGGGLTAAALWQWHQGHHAYLLSAAAGAGLIIFETAELNWLGFQPLEVVFAIVGALIITLAGTSQQNTQSPL
jgi:hypothetical protein